MAVIQPPPPLNPPKPLPWRWAAAFSVLAGLWVAIGEIDHILAQILDVDRTWSISQLTGTSSITDTTSTRLGWDFFERAANGDVPGPAKTDVQRWMHAYAVLDSLLALTYAGLAVAWARRVIVGLSTERLRFRRAGAASVVVAAFIDIVENWLISSGAGHPDALIWASRGKWTLLALGLVVMVACAGKGLTSFLRTLPSALYTHRYSVLVVLPLGLLSIGAGPDILEQIPDIQRRWSDADEGWDFFWAGLVMATLSVIVLAVGRERTRHLALRTCPYWTDKEHPCDEVGRPCPVRVAQGLAKGILPLLGLWLIGPLLFGLAALLLVFHHQVSGLRLFFFLLLPVSVFVWSSRLRSSTPAAQREHPAYRVYRKPIPRWQYDATARTGDAVVGLLPVIAGLGCIRAYTAPWALRSINDGGRFFLGAAAVVLLLAYPVFARLLQLLLRRSPQFPPIPAPMPTPVPVVDGVAALLTLERNPVGDILSAPVPPPSPPVPKVAWATLVVGAIGVLGVSCFPVPLATSIGVVATFQLALGSLSAVIAATVILVQRGEGPEAFWKLGLPYAPVTSLFLSVALAIGLVGHWSDVHKIRDADPVAFPMHERPTLDVLFSNWMKASVGCAQPLGNTGLSARPLLLFAAEGGGIRAAYWTADVVDRIQTDHAPPPGRDLGEATPVDPCRSAMLSSGASGGSVGLSIASAQYDHRATPAVRAIAGTRALGAAADGLVLRDTIFAASGVPLPSFGDGEPGAYGWKDRGTLIEEAWEHSIESLGEPFLATGRTDGWTWGPAGALVVNSTSTTTSCRMLVSQIELPDQQAECGADAAVAGSADLISCTHNLRYVTAALLTARFPYVTPSGVVTCAGDAEANPPLPESTLQIVDGGYGDNFGIGTIVDLAPQLMQRVREHNDCVLRATAAHATPSCDGEGNGDLVVPMLVYLDNGTGSDLVKRPGGIDVEVLVPPVTALGAKGNLVSASSDLQRAAAVFARDKLWDDTGAPPALSGALDRWRGSGIFVVSQATQPSIAAPLGWVLSNESMQAMDDALEDNNQDPVCQLDLGVPTKATPLECSDETAPLSVNKPGSLDQLLALLDR